MKSRIRRWQTPRLGEMVLLQMLAGCGTAPTNPDVVYFTTAVFTIVVRDAEAAPVPGVLVRIRTYLFSCGEFLRGGEGDHATDSTGQRRILASSLYSPHVARCVRVTVSQREPPNATLAEQDFPVELEFRVEGGTPRDSVRLEVALP